MTGGVPMSHVDFMKMDMFPVTEQNLMALVLLRSYWDSCNIDMFL